MSLKGLKRNRTLEVNVDEGWKNNWLEYVAFNNKYRIPKSFLMEVIRLTLEMREQKKCQASVKEENM